MLYEAGSIYAHIITTVHKTSPTLDYTAGYSEYNRDNCARHLITSLRKPSSHVIQAADNELHWFDKNESPQQ